MAKIKAIKSMIIAGPSESSQLAEVGECQSTQQTVQETGPVLDLASKRGFSRSRKRARQPSIEQRLVDEDFAELAATEQEEQTERTVTEKVDCTTSLSVWSLDLKYKGRVVTTTDSVYADKDYSLGFNMTKGLLLPTDMKKHKELSDLKVLRYGRAENYLAHERMISVQQSLREAIADKKAKMSELEKLRPSLAILNNDAKKARYLVELQKHRAAHQVELKKKVDEAEDRGFAEGERVYERQVEGTKDIFFHCGWKIAVEKLSNGPDSNFFKNPPIAFIPSHMQAYAAAVQQKMIEAANAASAVTAATDNNAPLQAIPEESFPSDSQFDLETVLGLDSGVEDAMEMTG
ncbi:unnamed protein product [Camellia sinensis]